MMNDVAHVFIIDDDPAVRESLTLLLEQSGFAVQAFAHAEDFLAVDRWEPRSCAIVDIQMHGMNGIQLQQQLFLRGWQIPLIFLTGYGDIAQSMQAIKAGAVNFLTKPVTGKDLIGSVQMALSESAELYAQAKQNQHATSRLTSLTERERQVMNLAIKGLPNKEIARHLDISHRTVEVHRARVMHKTGAATLIDLRRIADMSGSPA